MRGLKTQESPRFERFFQLVQNEAAKQNAVFFVFAGDGREFVRSDMEGEDIMGWLIPVEQVPAFEPAWEINNSETALASWGRFFVWAEWNEHGEQIAVSFKTYS